MKSAIFFLCAVAAASANSLRDPDFDPHVAFKSAYAISDPNTGDQKSASVARDGDVTKGSYSVLQPDGTIRTVNYVVTPKGGFQAEVDIKGEPKYPDQTPTQRWNQDHSAAAKSISHGAPAIASIPRPAPRWEDVERERTEHEKAHQSAVSSHLKALQAALATARTVGSEDDGQWERWADDRNNNNDNRWNRNNVAQWDNRNNVQAHAPVAQPRPAPAPVAAAPRPAVPYGNVQNLAPGPATIGISHVGGARSVITASDLGGIGGLGEWGQGQVRSSAKY